MSDPAPVPPTNAPHPLSGWVGYVLAVAAVAVATLVRFALDPVLGDNYPFSSFFGAVAVVAWWVRTRPSVAALLLSGVVSLYLFLPPRHSFAVNDPGVAAGLALFLAVGGVMVAMGHARRVALWKAERLLAEAVARRDEARKAADAEAEQRERLRTTLASIGDAVISTDRDGNVTYLNAVAEALTGWTTVEAVGMPLTRVFCIVNESTRQPVENPALRALTEGVVVGLANHTVLISKDGTERPIDDSAAPIRCREGEVVGSVLVFRDITARHQAEQRLQRSEERFRATFEQAAVGIAHVGLGGEWLRVNGKLCDILGYAPDELLARTFQDITHPDDLAADLADLRRLVAGEVTTYSMEKRYVRKDRSLVWATLTVSLVRTAGGRPDYFISVVEDISARKDAEEAVREARSRLESTLAAGEVGTWEFDVARKVVRADRNLARLFGLPGGGGADRPLDEFTRVIHPDDRGRVVGAIGRALEAGDGYEADYRVVGPDGAVRWVVARGRVERDGAGRAVRLPGVVVDITAQRRAEEAVRASEERFRSLVTATSQIVWTAAADGRVAEDSPTWRAFTGQTFDQWAGWGWLDAVHPDDRERTAAAWRRAVECNGIAVADYRLRRHDGEYCWTTVRAVPVFDAGRVREWIGTNTDITDRRLAEDRLRASEEKYRTLFESMDEGFCVIEFLDGPHGPLSDYVHVEANPAYTANAGIPDIVGRKVREMVPDEADGWVQIYRDVLVTGRPVRFERELVATGRHLDLAAFRIGPVERRQVAVLFKDVTARKTAEGRLRESEERLRLALDAAGMGTWVWTVATGEVVWSAKTREMFGVDAGTPVTYALFESRLHPDDLGPNRRKTEESLRTGEYENEYRLPLPGGGVRWVATRGQMLRDHAGRNARMLGVVADVTRRKQFEEERAAAERTLAALVERCPFGIYIVDADFRIANVNAGSQTGAFANVRPLIGRPFDEAMRVIWPEPVAAEVVGRFRHTLATGEAYRSTDFVNQRADIGQVEGYEWELHRLTLPDGRAGVVCYYYDSTRLRQVEQALRDADRRKDVFLATLAHELRNPLAPIRNGLQVIKLAGATGTVEQARTMMDRQLTHMVRLVDDLLDVSRITRGKLELRKERVELKAVVDAAVETARPVIEQAGHELVVAVPDEPLRVDADVTRLAQVFSNLLNNSAKYTHRGGHITLTAGRDGGAAVVCVKDDGIGIPPAMLERVFQMFVQVDRTLEKTTGGLGIGLSLVKGLVEMHGGTIAARSEGEGKGSEFVVRLPVVTPDAGQADRADRRAEEVVPPGPRRVLVVDDNADAADSLAQLLELLGNEVRTANDGEAGVAAAAAFRPAVVLCDIGMPKVNGYEAARRIRAEAWGTEMVLVALTGWGQDDDRRKTAEAGFDHHLVKPVEFAALTKLLSELPTGRD